MKTAKEMPEGLRMYQEIPYIVNDNTCLIDCPFYDKLGDSDPKPFRVGSAYCFFCKYNLETDDENKIVKCTYIEED